MDIILSSQNEPIKMVDDHGFDTGETTTEGIVYQTGQPIKIRLKYPQFTSDTEKGVVGNTTDMVHALGHVNGIFKGTNTEDNANKYAKEQFTDKNKE